MSKSGFALSDVMVNNDQLRTTNIKSNPTLHLNRHFATQYKNHFKSLILCLKLKNHLDLKLRAKNDL